MSTADPTLEERLMELELRYLEQEKLVQELSGVIYSQGRALERVTAEVENLRKKVVEPGVVDARETERPPHY